MRSEVRGTWAWYGDSTFSVEVNGMENGGQDERQADETKSEAVSKWKRVV